MILPYDLYRRRWETQNTVLHIEFDQTLPFLSPSFPSFLPTAVVMMVTASSENVLLTWRDKRQAVEIIPSTPIASSQQQQQQHSSSCDSSCDSSPGRPLNPTLRAIVPAGYDRHRLPDSPDGGKTMDVVNKFSLTFSS